MSTDTARNGQTMLKADRRTVDQLLAAAERDTEAVSVFMDGTCPEDSERAIFVVMSREHIAYLTQLCLRQGLLTEGKAVEGNQA